MALEKIELGDPVRTVIQTSQKNWKLRDVIPDANTTASPIDEQDLSAGSAISVRWHTDIAKATVYRTS